MYTLRQIEQAAQIVDKIKKLDGEILSLDGLASRVCSVHGEYRFKVKDHNPVNAKKETILEEDGSLKKPASDFGYNSMFIFFDIISHTKSEPKPEELIEFSVGDEELLTVIAVLLEMKYAKRKELREQIKELGVEIK